MSELVRATGESLDAGTAARILAALAQRQSDALGDLGAMGWDARALAESSGELDAIQALRMGAVALTRQAEDAGPQVDP